MEHFLHFFQSMSLFDSLNNLPFICGHNLSAEIVSYLEIVDNIGLLRIRSVEAQVTLRKPFWDVNSKGVTVRPLQYHVLVLIIIKEDICFIDNWLTFINGLHCISFRFIW